MKSMVWERSAARGPLFGDACRRPTREADDRLTRAGEGEVFANRPFERPGIALEPVDLSHQKRIAAFEIDNAGILITGNSAISMGHVTVIDANGNRTMVDKTWGYVRGPDGKLRIVLHHSSLPYSAG